MPGAAGRPDSERARPSPASRTPVLEDKLRGFRLASRQETRSQVNEANLIVFGDCLPAPKRGRQQKGALAGAAAGRACVQKAERQASSETRASRLGTLALGRQIDHFSGILDGAF
jgi:hypothetical protein